MLTKNKIKIYLMFALTAIIILLTAFTAVVSYAMENNDISISNDERQNLLTTVNELEESTRDINAYNISSTDKNDKRSLTVMDFNDDYVYIYMEFDLGGYAIYDRIGEFIYERSEQGDGPYIEYGAKDKLYYGGPENYFVKEKAKFINTVVDETIDRDTAKSYTDSLDSVREEIIDERENEQRELLAIDNSPSTNAAIGDILHINLGYSKGSSFAGQVYFNIMGYADWEYQYQLSDYRKKYYPTVNYSGYNTLSLQDVLFAFNKHGSCSIVALAMVMQYYDRLNLLYPNDGYRKMLPYNANQFREKYALERSYFDDNGTKVPNTDKNAYRGEYLHQELLAIMFPDIVVDENTRSVFGIHLEKMIPHVKTYFNKYGLQQTSLSKRSKDSGAIAQIKKGNPVMVSFQGNIAPGSSDPNINRNINHSVVAYGANAKVGLFGILTPIEYYVNFGWIINKSYCNMIVNKSLIYANMNFNVF